MSKKTAINNEIRLNLLVTALEEYGSTYWCRITKDGREIIASIHPPDGKTSFATRLMAALNAGLVIPIYQQGNETEKLGELSMKSIIEGEKLMKKSEPTHYDDIITGNDDGTTADLWLQYACLKEIIFG